MKNKFILFLVLNAMFAHNSIFSQELMTTLIANNPKSLFTNPALSPAKQSFLNLPIANFSANFNNSFSFSDITEKQNQNNYYVNTNELLRVLSDDNNFLAGKYSLDILHLGMAFNENDYLSFSFRNRFSAAGNLPHALAELVLDNPYNKYKTFDISSTFKFLMWNEVGASYSHKINENWRVGGRLKYLSGMLNVESEKLLYTVEKSTDYYLLSSDLDIRSNSFLNNEIKLSWFNPGVGVDIGVKYQTTDKRFTTNASVSDLGVIFWSKSNSTNTITRNPNNKLRFDGFGDLEKTFNGAFDLTTLFDSIGTEFKETIGLETVKDFSYSSSLPASFQASGTYAIDDNFSHNLSFGFAGTLLTSEKLHYAVSAGYYWLSKNKNWQLLTNYTYYGNSANGWGFGAAYNNKKFQIYVVADNIVSVFSPLNSKFIGFDLGICFFRIF